MSDRKPVYIVQHNHFDPIWRRCWDRPFDYKGKRYAPYVDVEERVINEWLEAAKSGAVFSEGQAVVVRKYLENNPERLDELKSLIADGRFELTGAGETVADTNMPSGETLLRNLVMGQRYFEDTFGVIPSIGWIEDAFGQSAQVPQLFRGAECTSIQALCYKEVPGPYWKGLDGSTILIGKAPCKVDVGNFIKIRPCDDCDGIGCEACDYTGLSRTSDIPEQQLMDALMSVQPGEAPYALIAVGGEEAMPIRNIVKLVAEAQKSRDDVEFIFGGYRCISERSADLLANLDAPRIPVSDQVEANPVSTGCYVSRIKIKQRFRHIENLVNTAERWATVAHLMGEDYPSECLEEAWRDVIFVAFHDAVTCSHIDAAYHELMDMLANAEHEATHTMENAIAAIESRVNGEAEKTYLVLYNSESWERDDLVTVNVSGVAGCPMLIDAEGGVIEILDVTAKGTDVNVTFRAPNVPALGYTAIEFIEDEMPVHSGEVTFGPGVVENEFYRITVSEKGIASIFDKRVNRELMDTSKYLCNELILEDDTGHPWGTMQPASFAEGLAQYTTGVRIREAAGLSEIIITGQYKGSDDGTRILSWRQKTTIYRGYDRIDFSTRIDWDTIQRRLRIAFPTATKTDEAMYSIPYGAIGRGKYEPDMSQLPSTNGDWPAVNWVDIHDQSADAGIALVNNGTPSHKVEDGVIFLSVLRSPIDSWCLNEPEHYDCPDYDGARDAGQHEFEYALIPHAGDYSAASIEKRAREFNVALYAGSLEATGKGDLGLTHSFTKFDAPDNVIVTAIKKADRDDSTIVRLAETAGASAQALVAIQGAGEDVSTVNFLERHAAPVQDKVEVGPFKIVTVRLSE